MAAPRPAVDPKELAALDAFCAEFGLFAHQPQLQLRRMAIDPASTDLLTQVMYEAWKADVLKFQAYHETEHPCPVAPPGTLDGRAIPIGLRQKADGQPITLDRDELSRSILVPGPTGEGKTTIGHHLLGATRATGHNAIFINPKSSPEAEALVASDPAFLVITPETPLNLIARAPDVSLAQHIALLVDVGAHALWSGDDYKALMTSTYETVLRDPHATMRDVHEALQRLPVKGSTWKFRDAVLKATSKAERLLLHLPGYHTSGAPGLDALFGRSLYLPLRHVTEAETFFISYLLHRLFAHNEHHDDGLYLIIVDEGLLTFAEDANTITGTSTLSALQGMGLPQHELSRHIKRVALN